MTYLVRFEGSFATKEEAIALANFIEGIKGKFTPEIRSNAPQAIEVRRSLQVWESTHDEAVVKPCVLLASIDFNSSAKEHDIDGVVPSAELVMSTKMIADVQAMEMK